MAKVEIEEEMLKEVENDIRDLINWIEVWNEQEKTGGTKLIEDEQAEKMSLCDAALAEIEAYSRDKKVDRKEIARLRRKIQHRFRGKPV